EPAFGQDEWRLLFRDLHDGGVETAGFPTDEDAMAAFRGGGSNGALFVDPPKNASDTARVRLVLPDGELRATLTLTQVKSALVAYEDQLRDQRSDRLQSQPLVLDTKAT